jgi:hypothetical protein
LVAASLDTAPATTQAKRILLNELTPGTICTIALRAVGGSTGHGPWSNPVTKMAI